MNRSEPDCRAAGRLHNNDGAVEFCQTEAAERFVVAPVLFFQKAYCNLFTQLQ